MKHQPAPLGLGIGWRPPLALFIDRHRDLGFVEIIAEDLDPWGALPPALEALRRRGVAIVPHGISLSLGGTEPLDTKRVQALAQLATRLDAPLVSEHVAFVRAAGLEAGHLLPVPRTRESLRVLVANVRTLQKELPIPLALENIASLFEWPGAEMDEATFIHELLGSTDALLLLDVTNLYANSHNGRWDAQAFLDRAPLDRLAYVHVAGGIVRNGVYEDSHAHPVMPAVLDLLETLSLRAPVPGALLERDDRFPNDDELDAELTAIRAALARGSVRWEAAYALR
jgi:hypothetical protein